MNDKEITFEELDRMITSQYRWEHIYFNDLVEHLKPLLAAPGTPYVIRPKSGKVEIREEAVDWNTPWIHVRHDERRNCALWMRIMYNYLHQMPVKCLGCWKVVVRPQTVRDLLKLLVIQEDLYNGPCKCGIEERPTVHGNYGGYFYNWSMEDGQECYRRVRALVDILIGKDTPVLLKRYCTEFELAFGPSNKMLPNAKEVYLQNALEKVVDIKPNPYGQPGWIKLHILRRWLERAYDVGDSSVKTLNDGDPFYQPYVTYHKDAPEIATGFRACQSETEEAYYGPKISTT
jgi:hypothetical protein